MLRPIQLLLILLLLAFMPVQSWASGVVRTVDAVDTVATLSDVTRTASMMHLAGAKTPDTASAADVVVAHDNAPSTRHADVGDGNGNRDGGPVEHGSAGDDERPGIDFAESLLPTPAPRMTPAAARLGLPGYAAATLPDPHLPLLPRPPRG